MFDFGIANSAQQEAISTTEGPLLIIAGPGTGKTFTLVQRISYLIKEKSVLPKQILVATFTEKAAKELITRICIPYYDPESQKLRHYYPDFFAVLNDGSYQLIEVKGDNKIDDTIVKAKADAANEVAVESSMKYIMYAGSEIEKTNVLNKKSFDSYVLPSDSEVLYSAESHKNYGEKKNG